MKIQQIIVKVVLMLTFKMEQHALLVNILVIIVIIQQIVVHHVLMDTIFNQLVVFNVLILVQSVLMHLLVQPV